VTLYYGDEKLELPVYDYAKLFLLAKTQRPRNLAEKRQTRVIREGRMNVRGQRSTRQSCG
jgi:hypothetical protein